MRAAEYSWIENARLQLSIQHMLAMTLQLLQNYSVVPTVLQRAAWRLLALAKPWHSVSVWGFVRCAYWMLFRASALEHAFMDVLTLS